MLKDNAWLRRAVMHPWVLPRKTTLEHQNGMTLYADHVLHITSMFHAYSRVQFEAEGEKRQGNGGRTVQVLSLKHTYFGID